MATAKKRAALAISAILCTESPKKKRRRRIWTKTWLRKRDIYGLSVLQKELEVDDMAGFRELLRMSVEDFSYLLERVTPHIIKKDTHLRKAISPRDRLSVTLRFLATGETFKSLGFQYRIGSTTLSRIVMETCTALTTVLRDVYLKTPSTDSEWTAIARDFEDKWQFPHCLGAIDGKHVFIQPPRNSEALKCYTCMGSNNDDCNLQGSKSCPSYSDACAVVVGLDSGVMKSCSYKSFCSQAGSQGYRAPGVRVHCCYSDDCNVKSFASPLPGLSCWLLGLLLLLH